MTKEANILVQSSDYYCPFSGVMLASLFENNRHLQEINIYFLADNISEKNIKKIEELVQSYNRNVFFLSTENINALLESSHAPKVHGSYTTLFKLLTMSQIDNNVDRIIYIDSDMVINDKIDFLLDINLDNYICAMAKECASFDYKNIVGYPSYENWYNGGLIVFNLSNWRKKHCEKEILDRIKRNDGFYPVLDQDILNVMYYNDIMPLSSRYNYMYSYELLGFDVSRIAFSWPDDFYYQFIESGKSPVIYHCFAYNGLRPWNRNAVYPEELKWDYYLSKTPWLDYNKEYVKMPFVNQVSRVLKIVLPKKLYAFFHRKAYLHSIKSLTDQWN